MGYKDTIEYLYSLYRHGIKLGLESISSILSELENPHGHYQTLHVGGTNGKGSTAAALAELLCGSGYRTGLYTSPHLVDFRERIRVNGTYISEARVVELTQQLQAATKTPLTFFEFTTAMAFQYFAQEQVEVAVIEVGMGGRFDATNVLTPLGVVITSIAHDHERYLGNTLTEIAFEKAGIIKEGVPVILGNMPVEAEQVLREVAQNREAPCLKLGMDFHVTPQSSGTFRYVGVKKSYQNLVCSLAGEHQMNNAGCALALLETVGPKQTNLEEHAVRSALSRIVWEGRLETLEHQPRLVIDGAHNPAAVTTLLETLTPILGQHGGDLIVILGMMQDKKQAAFMRELCRVTKHLILTNVSVLRAATVTELKQNVPLGFDSIYETEHPADALRVARGLAKPHDVICVTGSLFLAGEVRQLLISARSSSL